MIRAGRGIGREGGIIPGGGDVGIVREGRGGRGAKLPEGLLRGVGERARGRGRVGIVIDEIVGDGGTGIRRAAGRTEKRQARTPPGERSRGVLIAGAAVGRGDEVNVLGEVTHAEDTAVGGVPGEQDGDVQALGDETVQGE